MSAASVTIAHARAVFATQVTISFAVMGFSMGMLLRGDPGSAGTYLPILTTILAFWFPSPQEQLRSRTADAADLETGNAAQNLVTTLRRNAGNLGPTDPRRERLVDPESPPPPPPPSLLGGE